MAYVTPGTVAAGDVATAAAWNVLVGNDVEFRSYSNRYARAKLTSGSVNLNSTNVWANVSTSLDLTLNASTGDVIEYAISAVLNNAANEMYFDVVTIVSGSPVNSFGRDAAPADPSTNYGIQGWLTAGSFQASVSGSVFRTLVSGDISSGTVTLRLRYASANSTVRGFAAYAAQPAEVWALNHGPVTT